jgi:hypothetical protein
MYTPSKEVYCGIPGGGYSALATSTVSTCVDWCGT